MSSTQLTPAAPLTAGLAQPLMNPAGPAQAFPGGPHSLVSRIERVSTGAVPATGVAPPSPRSTPATPPILSSVPPLDLTGVDVAALQYHVTDAFERQRMDKTLLALRDHDFAPLLESLPVSAVVAADDAAGIRTATALYLQGFLRQAQFELTPPTTKPTTRSHIYAVSVPACVFKLFHEAMGFCQEVAALTRFADNGVPVASLVHLGTFMIAGQRRGFVLMHSAGIDLERYDLHQPDPYVVAMRKAGTLLQRLHQQFAASRNAPAIEQVRQLHVSRVANLAHPDGPLVRLCRKFHWLDDAQLTRVCARIERLAQDYANAPQAELPLGMVHGDFHMSNVVINQSTGDATLIDVQTAVWSTDPAQRDWRAITDVREDMGRFYSAIRVHGQALNLDEAQIGRQQNAFMEGYNLHAQRRITVEELEFFSLRYFVVALRNLWQSLEATPPVAAKLSVGACQKLVQSLIEPETLSA